MIKYKFLKYEISSSLYISNLHDVYELVIDKNLYSYNNKYIVCYQPIDTKEREKILFRCNDKYELMIWMDLNGFMIQDCRIFYNKKQMIEYASILLKKEN